MKRFSWRMVGIALALAAASGSAISAPYGRGYGYGYGHGYGYHGGYYGGYRGSSYNGWWIGAAALGLFATGAYLAASQPVYAAPPVIYSPPVVYSAPVYAAPPVVYAPPVQYAAAPVQYEPAPPPATAKQARDTTDCRRWAMNQSGYDPATISQYTTPVMVNSYNQMLNSCMTSRGYRAN